jgi:hypothetical protein
MKYEEILEVDPDVWSAAVSNGSQIVRNAEVMG